MRSPCRRCSKRQFCDNKACPRWRKWFGEKWEQVRQLWGYPV